MEKGNKLCINVAAGEAASVFNLEERTIVHQSGSWK